MTEDQFVRMRQADWKNFETEIKVLGKRGARPTGMTGFPARYRRLCQDLNQSQACRFSISLIERLNHLVWEGHQILYKKSAITRQGFAHTVMVEFPRLVRREYRAVLVGHLIFYGLALLIFFYILANSNSVELFMTTEQSQNLAAMYNPNAEHFLKPRGTNGSADMFGFYILNNIGIACRTFAGGALAGVGSLFFLAYNAIAFGAATAYIVKLGYVQTFFQFIITHSAFELTALILFAVAGLRIGWAWIAPGQFDRRSAFAAKAREMMPIISGSFIFLVMAAGLEAFWSSQILAPAIKYCFGGIAWALVGLFFIFGGRRNAG